METFSFNTELSRKLAESIAANPPQPMIPSAIIEAERRNNELMGQIRRTAHERDERENAKLEALQETAKETRGIRERQDRIIDNQQLLIDYQKEQTEVLAQQLQVLKELFASGEDGVVIQKEIMRLLIEQEENNHSIRDLLKDKGGDLGVAAITATTPLVWAAIKSWLSTKGVIIP